MLPFESGRRNYAKYVIRNGKALHLFAAAFRGYLSGRGVTLKRIEFIGAGGVTRTAFCVPDTGLTCSAAVTYLLCCTKNRVAGCERDFSEKGPKKRCKSQQGRTPLVPVLVPVVPSGEDGNHE